MKNTIILFIMLFLLVSCSTIKDAGKVLRNEKIKTTDEFLVEKRDPLVFPTRYLNQVQKKNQKLVKRKK